MDYSKILEKIPQEKWNPLSEQLIGVILGSKSDEKMKPELANEMLMHMSNSTTNTANGLAVLLKAAVLLDCEKTVTALGDLQLLKVAELIVQSIL